METHAKIVYDGEKVQYKMECSLLNNQCSSNHIKKNVFFLDHLMMVYDLTGIQWAPVTLKRGICLPRDYRNEEVSKGHDWLIEIPSPAETTSPQTN